MSQSEQAIVRHLSGFFAALERFVVDMNPKMDQLKKELDKQKQ